MKSVVFHICTLIAGLHVLVSAGCGQSPYSGPTRYPLTGIVTLDGEPVDGGSISFIPEDANLKVAGGVISGGAYSVPAEQGANAGTHRVEIHWMKPTGKKIPDSDLGGMMDQVAEAVPEKFSSYKSDLRAEVSSSATNFDFDLVTK